jgi:hypothetical protein
MGAAVTAAAAVSRVQLEQADRIARHQPHEPLKLEAGQTIFNAGALYNLFLVLNDLSDSSKTVYTSTQGGSLGDPNWTKMDVEFSWTVPPGTVPLVDDHVYQAIGVMSVGKADPIVDAEQSDLFIVTQP